MKKFAIMLAVVSTFTGNSAFAQNNKMGNAAQSGGTYSAETFAWGIGLGAVAVIAVVAGVTAAAASSTGSIHTH